MDVTKCPICGEGDIGKPVVMAKIAGTDDGEFAQCVPVHVNCLDLQIIIAGKGGYGYAGTPKNVLFHVIQKGKPCP